MKIERKTWTTACRRLLPMLAVLALLASVLPRTGAQETAATAQRLVGKWIGTVTFGNGIATAQATLTLRANKSFTMVWKMVDDFAGPSILLVMKGTYSYDSETELLSIQGTSQMIGVPIPTGDQMTVALQGNQLTLEGNGTTYQLRRQQ